MDKRYIIPIFVPHLGCPHDCVFCNQRKITNKEASLAGLEVEDTIERYLSYFKKEARIEVAFYGGSFTAIDMELQKELLSIAASYKDVGRIHEIRLSTRPDAISIEILEHLKHYGVDTIELGVQSLDNEVLMASGRGHSVNQVYEAVELIKSYDFKLGLQMMVGLPEDSLKKSLYTAREFIRLEPDCVRVYPTLVIKDTFLEKLASMDKYKPLDLDKAVDMVTPILINFYLNDINVIRVGLQPTENIQLGYDVISGPFHPSFRQLVESNIYKYVLEHYFRDKEIQEASSLEIGINGKNISNLVGQKSSNTKYLRKKYKFKEIKVSDKDIEPQLINIKIGEFQETINTYKIMEMTLKDLEKICMIRGV